MKIFFLGPRGAQGVYNFPKLGISNLVPGDYRDVPPAAGRVLINTGLAEPAHEEQEADAAPDELSELAEAFRVESDEDSNQSTSDESGSVATESEDEE